jgi:hypothetical protein
MKIKITYTIKDFNDSYILEGDTIEEIREANEIEMRKRGLDSEENDMYSEEIY